MTPLIELDGFDLVERPMPLLIVEPDAAERARLRSGLEPRFRVVEASTADEAVEQLKEQYFEAILAAYEIGERNGVWLLEYVAERHHHVHRALMSTMGVPNLSSLIDGGVVWLYKAKPVDPVKFGAYFADVWKRRTSKAP